MTFIFGILLTTWTVCFALPDVHKQMTIGQLQSVFHVDNIESVPKYELIQLLHQFDDGNQNVSPSEVVGHSVRKRRSITNHMEISGKNVHHVKKDLSKSPYYSELKQLIKEQNNKNSISDNSYSEKLRNLDLSDLKEHNVSFSAFGEHLNLTLKKTEGLFKDGPNSLRMWTVRSEPNSTQGVEYEEIVDEEPSASEESQVGEVYQDENNMAAILMRRHLQTGDLIMEGSIGHELVIKPLPHELSPNKDKAHHVIYKRSLAENDQLSDFAYMEPDQFEQRYRKKRSSKSSQSKWSDSDDDLIASETNLDNSEIQGNLENDKTSSLNAEQDDAETAESRRNKRAAPYIIYPEILVIVDYDGYRLHGGDNVQVKRYFVSFWNGVDLRYRLLKGPRIRISIAGIIISRGRDATPYLERNRVGRDAIDSAAALTDMGKYLFRERRLPVYDIAVAITKYDMCRRRKGGRCTKGTAGFAYVGGACVVNKRLEKVNSVAIIEDTGGFSGIIVAAHEVGHLLGAVHDGSPPPSYLGGPGAERCRWEDGYIMSDLRHTERGFRWSPCTIQSFHHFLNGDTASCLHNAPHEDSALGRSLPGTLLSLDAQCRRDRGTYACFKDDRVCAQLFCFDSQTGYCVAYRPAAEGSSCGNGVYCLDGRCVAQQPNTIPDYSSQFAYRTYNSTTSSSSSSINSSIHSSATTTPTITTLLATTTTATTTTNTDDNNNNNNNNHNNFNIPTPKYSKFTKLIRKQHFEKYNYETENNNNKDNININIHNNDNNNKQQNNDNDNNNNNDNSDDIIDPETILELKKEINLNLNNNGNNNNNNNNNNNDNNPLNTNSHHTSTSPTHRSYIFGGRSTTRSLYFDQYYRKLTTTTKTPTYYIESIGQYFKKTSISSSTSSSTGNTNNNNNSNNNNNNNNNDHNTTILPQRQNRQQQQHHQELISDLHVIPATQHQNHPSISTNYLGDNTNNLPVNISVPDRRIE
ncbi:A disintegrin and metalloproteinase with thrombospondin motifs like isoform X2 [Condylostylus longicornis]|uniref:A disintegrin and metalloproteinase with thrombospondin motifs like isoform X2 n=1 Tax=Condylostylus longicornis TaxID=2530218 RepID=UPI00244DD4F8|nr:A disintegrin and metalloproteinase with thrombospondin motifs like isoform X2 [Condylostylus longicornis]